MTDPILLPAPGNFHNAGGQPLMIGMASATANAEERHTLDGSTPTDTHGVLFTKNAGWLGGVFVGNSPVTVKVIAFVPSPATDSNVITGIYNIDAAADPRTQMPDPAMAPNPGTYRLASGDNTMGFIIATSVPGAYLRYTLDGSTPTPTHGAVITQNVGQIDLALLVGQTTHTWTVSVIAYGLEIV